MVFGAVLGVLVPNLASADSAAVCHQTDGSSSYEFDGQLAVGGTGSKSRVVAYGGEFYGYDSEHPEEIPEDAKNDFQIDILTTIGGTIVVGEHTPDTIDFFVPYTETPSGWNLPPDRWYFGRYVAAFDKRGKPDEHCTADTPDFYSAPNPPPPPPEVCNAGQVDCNKIFES